MQIKPPYGGFIFVECVYSFSNTENISQCGVPVNWSIGIACVILYPPVFSIWASRINVAGLQDTYIIFLTLLRINSRHCDWAPARGGSITMQSY